MERIFVSAIESITSLGNNHQTTWQALLQGHSGVSTIEHFDTQWLPVHRSAEIKTFGQWDRLSCEENRRFNPAVQLAVACIRSVLDRACLLTRGGRISDPFVPLFFATTQGDFLVHLNHLQARWSQSTSAVLPTAGQRPGYPGCSVLEQTALALGLKGWLILNSNACAAGGYALASALAHLRRGLSEQALVAGVDITSAFIFSGFCSLRILAPLQCRPFDQERQGLVLGDGAAALLLETERSLKNRGGKALAEVLGYGWSSDAYHLAAPQPQGLGMIRAMNQALKDSGLSAGAVDVVLAHGTGTLANDAIEARAMAKVFNGRAVPVTAAKGAVGHTIGAAGLIEANLAVTSLVEQLIPPTVNHHQLDPQCPVKVVNRPQTTALKVALTNATAFGGTNCTLLFKAWEG